uniref:Uncharacterized protein n=1 Tax=Methylocapsa acidiphila TaxID=133552 RepID=Q2VNM4_METAI|nr:hypothetical protein orf45 [Methylocapsa acidiphila]
MKAMDGRRKTATRQMALVRARGENEKPRRQTRRRGPCQAERQANRDPGETRRAGRRPHDRPRTAGKNSESFGSGHAPGRLSRGQAPVRRTHARRPEARMSGRAEGEKYAGPPSNVLALVRQRR